MRSRLVILVSILAVALIIGSATEVLAKPRQAGPVTCRFGGPGKVMCCQDRPGSGYNANQTVTWCTICDNTSPPSNCSDRYCVSGCAFASTRMSLPPTNALPPSGNNSGTPPPGSIIKVPPGTVNSFPTSNSSGTPPSLTIYNGRNPASPNIFSLAGKANNSSNSTGNPIAMTSSDNPPGCSKKVPIPPNCTLNPFNNSALNKGKASLGNIIKAPVNHTSALPTGNYTSTQPPALKLSQPSLAGQQQTTGHHHHKGSSTGASTSAGSNSTGH